jgi:hypothetical protein
MFGENQSAYFQYIPSMKWISIPTVSFGENMKIELQNVLPQPFSGENVSTQLEEKHSATSIETNAPGTCT